MVPNNDHHHASRHMDRHLTVGFVVLIVLMAALIAHAAWYVADLKERMGRIVEIHSQKIYLATDLQESSYNRHNSLVYLVLAEDPFERDEYFQQFIKWGHEVGKARALLKAMPLDDIERASLAAQDRIVVTIIERQETISDLARGEHAAQARALLSTSLRPLNREYTDLVENLRRHERDLIRMALDETRAATQRLISLHLLVGSSLLLLATLIAVKTRRLLAHHSGTILDQVHKLELVGSRLEHEATHDALTDLANRVLFYRRLEEAMLRAVEDRFSIAVMYVDLDDFKAVNDQHGHAQGDLLLQAVATRLRNVTRLSDTAARLGGDEFALLFLGVQETDECPPLCRKVEEEVGQPLKLGGRTYRPRCSVGYALYPRDSDNLDGLLSVADARMYERKRARKGEIGQGE